MKLTKPLLLACLSVTLLVPSAPARSRVDTAEVVTPLPNSLSFGPRIEGGLPTEVRFRLATASKLAVRSLRRVPECQALFDDLGANGLQLFTDATFSSVRSRDQARRCGSHVVAFTTVGGRDTVLCPGAFVLLNRYEAAITLIHETLHHAGLGEKPHDPAAMTPLEINRMVGERCQL